MGAGNREYRGTIGLRDVVVGPPAEATALALTCWDDSFSLHGIQLLATPPPAGPIPAFRGLEAVTDTGSKHDGGGGGGHGHPRFLWHWTFRPALPSEATSLTLSGVMLDDDRPVSTLIEFSQRSPATYDAPTQIAAAPSSGIPERPDRPGPPLPERVIALGADLGVHAGIRRAVTSLYSWPSWFLLTIEADGNQASAMPRAALRTSWVIDDDRGNHYAGAWSGGWSGGDNGVHVAVGPGLDPRARLLRLSFTDPFGSGDQLATVLAVPDQS